MSLRSASLVLVSSFLCIQIQAYAAEEIKTPSQALTLAHTDCEELLSPNASSHFVEPWFHANNPATADLDLWSMRHKFSSAFSFSADGKYVAIHHDIYPDAEQITLRSLDSGEKLSSWFWKGKGRTLFDLRSAAFDGDSRRLVGLAENYFTDRTDAVVSWDGRNDSLIENVEIQPPQDADYRSVSEFGKPHSYRTAISLEQPYYVRTHLRSAVGGSREDREFSAQIVDWQNKFLLNLPEASENYLNVVSKPLNSQFRYAAVLQKDGKTIQLMPFDKVASQMGKGSEPVSGLLANVRKSISSLLGGGSKETQLALASSASNTTPTSPPQFTAALVHDQWVKRAVLSQWAAFIVTQTQAGLHIWNAKSGEEIGFIGSPVHNFRVLDKMGVLAYGNGKGNLILYSLFQARQIASLEGFSYDGIDVYLENHSQGLAYVTLRNGSVIRVTETIAPESREALYEISDTGIQFKVPVNISYRSQVQTKKAKYFAQVYETLGSKRQLAIDFYSLDGAGKLVTSMSFPVGAFQSQFSLDPTGSKVVYTRGETETGILHLDRLLEDRGF